MPFRDVVGHRRPIGLLAQSVARQSLPPSLIFAGPAGVGKRLAATALAQALNCLDPKPWSHPAPGARHSAQHLPPDTQPPPVHDGVDACGVCAACARITRGMHPDVLVLEPDEKGSIKIERVRDMIEHAGYRPFEGRKRVVIIDEADALEPGAQNALLKTLEEPPSSSVFVLVTSRPDVLLPTVRSRCPQLRFRALSADDLVAALVPRGFDQAKVRAVAAIADGSIGRALQVLEERADELVEARALAERVLVYAASTPDVRRRIEGTKDLLEGTGKGATAAEDRALVAARLRSMASILRDVELLSLSPNAPAAVANADIRPILDRLTPAYRGERGMHAFAAVDQALVALERNASPKIVADWLVLEL